MANGSDDGRLLDPEEVFDADYLYFYEPALTEDRTAREVSRIQQVLDVKPGQSVLEIGCGHGRLSNELARQEFKVSGLDVMPGFLDMARKSAAEGGVIVDYHEGDMREMAFDASFDAAFIWFTTFGYFDEPGNLATLKSAARALKSGGRLAIEQVNRNSIIRHGVPVSHVVEVGDDVMIDKVDYDPMTDRSTTLRTTVRDGRMRRSQFSIRLFGPVDFTEIFREAGFADIAFYGANGAPFTLYDNRIIAVATKA